MSHQPRQAQPVGRTEPREPRGAGLYPSPGLRPAALPGDLVAIRSEDEVRRVIDVMAQPGVNAFQDGVDVAAGGESTDNELDVLELPDNFAGQFRIVHPSEDIPTDVRFLWDIGAQNAQSYATNNQRGFMDHQTATLESEDSAGNTITGDLLNAQLLEIYTFEGQDLFITFDHTNSGGAQQTVSNVRFSGYMYRLSPEPVPFDRGDDRQPVPWPNAPLVPKSANSSPIS